MGRAHPMTPAAEPMATWHSGDEHLDATTARPFLHAGTLAQARMRGGAKLTRILVARVPMTRMVDRGENAWRRRRLVDAMRRGCAVAVYLNRFEGIPLEEFDAARAHPAAVRLGGIDNLPDSVFRRLMPSAADSIVVLDPSAIVAYQPWDADDATTDARQP